MIKMATFVQRLRAPDWPGLAARCAALTLLMGGVLLASLAVHSLFESSVPVKWLWATFLVVFVAMMSGLIAAEIPRGTDFILMRLAVATFCRTGFPLLVILVAARYSNDPLEMSTFGYFAAYYLFGFPASVALSVLVISSPPSQT